MPRIVKLLIFNKLIFQDSYSPTSLDFRISMTPYSRFSGHVTDWEKEKEREKGGRRLGKREKAWFAKPNSTFRASKNSPENLDFGRVSRDLRNGPTGIRRGICSVRLYAATRTSTDILKDGWPIGARVRKSRGIHEAPRSLALNGRASRSSRYRRQ